MVRVFKANTYLINEMPKRSFSSSRGNSKRRRTSAYANARAVGGMPGVSRMFKARNSRNIRNYNLASRVNKLYRMIETKESQTVTGTNVALAHNNVTVLQASGGGNLSLFQTAQGAQDPMAGTASRVGDQIAIKGIMIKGFFENALNRAKVYYRLMVIKGAKGDSVTRATLYKGDAGNKMIDQVNTERYTIIAQKIFTLSYSNSAPTAVDATGVPTGGTAAGISNRIVKLWIPGHKFGRGGLLQYENGSATQAKFFDYTTCIVAYDWYGTPQDANNVGRINELYTKCYFKDA